MNKGRELMPKIAETYPIGDVKNMTLEQLAWMLSDMYRDLAIAINKRIEVIERTTNGQATDTSYSNGTVNINTSTNNVEMLTNHDTATTVIWSALN